MSCGPSVPGALPCPEFGATGDWVAAGRVVVKWKCFGVRPLVGPGELNARHENQAEQYDATNASLPLGRRHFGSGRLCLDDHQAWPSFQ